MLSLGTLANDMFTEVMRRGLLRSRNQFTQGSPESLTYPNKDKWPPLVEDNVLSMQC